MGIAYDDPVRGAVTLTAHHTGKRRVIEPGHSPEFIERAIADFFAADLEPPKTRDDVILALSHVSGVPIADFQALINGRLPTRRELVLRKVFAGGFFFLCGVTSTGAVEALVRVFR